MRLKDKIAVVVGAGQSPGEGLGNGRATVLRFAQESTKVLTVDNRPLLSRGESRHCETSRRRMRRGSVYVVLRKIAYSRSKRHSIPRLV
jgi:NAD(P)-dependent dehydrogenase (short-subunit alcohol dehydrogenase family)